MNSAITWDRPVRLAATGATRGVRIVKAIFSAGSDSKSVGHAAVMGSVGGQDRHAGTICTDVAQLRAWTC